MWVLLTYDVSTTTSAGRRRLRRVADACRDYGLRVQFSVFECRVSDADWVVLRRRLIDEIDAREDSLRFYFLSADPSKRVEHHGAKAIPDIEGPLIV